MTTKTKQKTLDFSNKISWSHLAKMLGYYSLFVTVIFVLGDLGSSTSLMGSFIEILAFIMLFAIGCVYLSITEYRNSYVVFDGSLVVTEYRSPWSQRKMVIPIQTITAAEIKRTWFEPRSYLWITIAGEQHMLRVVTCQDQLCQYLRQQIHSRQEK